MSTPAERAGAPASAPEPTGWGGAGPGTDAPACARVLRPGMLSTFQDLGRIGLAHLGVPASGAADRGSHDLANRLVGNPVTAATIETTLDGLRLWLDRPRLVAVTGADAEVLVNDRPAPLGLSLTVPPGATLEITPARRGLRNYLAVAGGWQSTPTLGSVSTDTLSGLGPPPLRAGDPLRWGAESGPHTAVDVTLPPMGPADLALVVQPGPRGDWLSDPWPALLSRTTWTVSAASNRVGLRLEGPPIPRRAGELPSEGIISGAVQLPPSGRPVVFLVDHPTTGGYPVIGVLDRNGVDACAQLRPGDLVRFSAGQVKGGAESL